MTDTFYQINIEPAEFPQGLDGFAIQVLANDLSIVVNSYNGELNTNNLSWFILDRSSTMNVSIGVSSSEKMPLKACIYGFQYRSDTGQQPSPQPVGPFVAEDLLNIDSDLYYQLEMCSAPSLAANNIKAMTIPVAADNEKGILYFGDVNIAYPDISANKGVKLGLYWALSKEKNDTKDVTTVTAKDPTPLATFTWAQLDRYSFQFKDSVPDDATGLLLKSVAGESRKITPVYATLKNISPTSDLTLTTLNWQINNHALVGELNISPKNPQQLDPKGFINLYWSSNGVQKMPGQPSIGKIPVNSVSYQFNFDGRRGIPDGAKYLVTEADAIQGEAILPGYLAIGSFVTQAVLALSTDKKTWTLTFEPPSDISNVKNYLIQDWSQSAGWHNSQTLNVGRSSTQFDVNSISKISIMIVDNESEHSHPLVVVEVPSIS